MPFSSTIKGTIVMILAIITGAIVLGGIIVCIVNDYEESKFHEAFGVYYPDGTRPSAEVIAPIVAVHLGRQEGITANSWRQYLDLQKEIAEINITSTSSFEDANKKSALIQKELTIKESHDRDYYNLLDDCNLVTQAKIPIQLPPECH